MFGNVDVHIRKEILNFQSGNEHLIAIHLSDFHLPFSRKRIPKIIEKIELVNPELIFLTGDYVDFKSSIEEFKSFVEKISKGRNIYYVLGNHDRRFKTEITSLLSSIDNFFNVEKKTFTYYSKSNFKYIISSWKNRNWKVSLKEGRQIVLMHNPRFIKIDKCKDVDLILAGHVHGAQFVFKKLKNTELFPGNIFYPHCYESKVINNTKIILSKGLGDVFPVRYNCPYEIVEILIQ